MKPLDRLCNAYREYLLQSVPMHKRSAGKELFDAAKSFAASRGWESWTMDLVHEPEMHACKCTECGDLHMRRGFEPGLYINGKSLQQLEHEEGVGTPEFERQTVPEYCAAAMVTIGADVE